MRIFLEKQGARISALLLTVAILLALAVVINASATEETDGPSLKISAVNLYYDDSVHIAFAATLDGVFARDTRLLVWQEQRDAYESGTESYSVEFSGFSDVFGQRMAIYCTDGVGMGALGDYIYVRLVGRESGSDADIYSDVVRYSPVQYAHDRLLDDITEEQRTEYLRLIEKERSMRSILQGAEAEATVYVELSGGRLPDGHSKGVYLPGDSVTVSTDIDGFALWADQYGAAVSRNASFDIALGETGQLLLSAVADRQIEVSLVGATFADGSDKRSFSIADTLTATYTETSGRKFLYWQNSAGKVISTDKTLSLEAWEIADGEIFTAVTLTHEGATFDDIKTGTVIGKTAVYSEGNKVYDNLGAGATVVVTDDPRGYDNKVLSVTKSTLNKGDSLCFGASGSGKGCYLLEFDICFDDYIETTLLQINMGDAYRIQITAIGDYILINDATTDGSVVNFLGGIVKQGEWIHIRAEHYQGDGSLNGRYTKIYINGQLTAISNNTRNDNAAPNYSEVRFYSLMPTSHTYYIDNVVARRENGSFVDDGGSDTLYCGRESNSEMSSSYKWMLAELTIGKEATDALKDLVSIFDDRVYIWYANLFDPETCAFYYSNDARDYAGFLPDLESTAQAMSFLVSSGIGNMADIYTDEMKETIVKWVQSLQSDDDGYFYHPQWGTSISVSRRGRDNGWATSLLDRFGADPIYPTANDRLAGNASSASSVLTSPLERSLASAVSSVIAASSSTAGNAHLKSKEAFIAYLDELFAKTLSTAENGQKVSNSYSIGNTVGSQSGAINAAGLTDVCIDYFNSKQNPNTGLWEEDVNYRTVSGLMKIGGMYNSLKRELPYADKAIRSAIDVAASEKRLDSVVYVYNPLVAINNTLSNVNKYSQSEDKDEFRKAIYAELQSRALELINNTRAKLIRFKKEDGSFSYGVSAAPAKSQGAPVCFGNNEGDVNGCGICRSTVANLFSALGLSMPKLYDAEDTAVFTSIIMNKQPIKKLPSPP